VLVGSSRVDLVNTMKDSFGEVCTSGSPRMWLITSPPGWGKTRLVQELYAGLAAAQPESAAYWPPCIVDADESPVGEARKRIAPPVVTAGEGRTAIPWLWWGTQAFALGDGSLGRALEQGADQLYAHGEALIRAERSFLGTVKDAFDVTSATVGILAMFIAALAAPPLAVPLAVGTGVEMVVTGGSRLRNLARRRRLRESGPQVAAAQFEQDLTSRLAERIVQLSKAVPILLVIDDAHDADQVTIGVLDRVLQLDTRFMIVATAWPEVTSDTDDRPLACWLRSLDSSFIGRKVERVELDPLSPADLRQIVSSLAPGTVPAVCDAFARRYDNPLDLRYVLELPRVRRRTSQGRIEVQPREVANLPDTLAGVFDEAWTDMPPSVQSALALAALSGPRFVPDLVVRAGQQQHLGFSPDDLEAAARTYQWTRAIDRSLHAFIEQSFYRVATGRAQEFLGEEEERAVRVAVAELGIDPEAGGSLSYRAGIEVNASYVGLVEATELPSDSRAVHSALSLGMAKSLRGDIAGATALFDRAAEWAGDADDRLSVATKRGWLQGLQGDYRGAVATIEQALASEPEAAQHRSALGARSDLAWWVSHGIDRAKGVEMCRQLIESTTAALGPDDELTLVVRKNYVDGLGQVGRVHEARELSEELINDLTRVLGANASWTLIERGYQAYWVHELEGPDRAVELIRDLLPAMVAELGPTIGPSLANRNNLVQWLRESGQWAQAEQICREAVSDLDTYGSPPGHDTDDLRIMMADFDFRAGRLAAAADQMVSVLDSFSLPLTDPRALQVRSNLGYALWSDGRTAEALAVYRKLLPDLTHTLPAGHELIAQTVSNINTLSAAQRMGGTDTV
jgi:tetratricopeptide (TPR) repeat protein